jgi:glycosyltransferase involved in cell wall biosynthesis
LDSRLALGLYSTLMVYDNSKNFPLVSIIVPCYGQGHFLGEAIESVLNQTYPNHEIIVVDDGSPDDTSQVASRYSGVRLIRQENRGLSAARNRGISESHGRVLVFLDADDRLLPGALESGLTCMAQRPESELVFARYRAISEDGSPSGVVSDLCAGDLYLGLLVRNCIGPVAPVMFRREIFDKVGGFDTNISPASDYDIYLRIARRYQTHRHDGIVAEYRVYNSSMSADPGLMLRAVIISLRSQQTYVKGDVERERAYRAGLRFWRELYGEPLYNQTSRRVLEMGNWKRKVRDLWYLIRYYPQSITLHGSSRISKLITHLKRA